MDCDLLAARQDRRHCCKSTMRVSIEMQQGDLASDLMVHLAYQTLLAAVSRIWSVYVSCVHKGIVTEAARLNGRHRAAEAYCIHRHCTTYVSKPCTHVACDMSLEGASEKL